MTSPLSLAYPTSTPHGTTRKPRTTLTSRKATLITRRTTRLRLRSLTSGTTERRSKATATPRPSFRQRAEISMTERALGAKLRKRFEERGSAYFSLRSSLLSGGNMKALIISADSFEDSELLVPYYRLKGAGVEVEAASLSRGAITGKHGYEVAVD